MRKSSAFLFLIVLLTSTIKSRKKLRCLPGHPFLSAGDFNITEENFEDKLASHKNLLIQITSYECEPCCVYEEQIDKYANHVLRNQTSMIGKFDVKLGRVEITTSPWFLEKYQIPYLPYWIFFKKGKKYQLTQPKNEYLNTINIEKILNPFKIIDSFEMFEELLKFKEVDYFGRVLFRTKVLAMFDSPDSYDEILNDVFKAADDLTWRLDLNFIIVTEIQTLRKINEKYGKKFFEDDFDKNSLIIYSHKNRFEENDRIVRADLDSGKIKNIKYWIAQSSTIVMDEYTSMNQYAYPADVPLLVAFVDPSDFEKSYQFVKRLREVGLSYIGKINFVWVDYEDNKPLMKKLGVYGQK